MFTIFVPLNPPLPNQQSDGFPLEFIVKGPQTELRTLSQNCEQTLQKLRTNRIMNQQVFLKNGRFPKVWGRAKRAEKASRGETVQKGVYGESVSSLPSGVLESKPLRGQRRNGLSKNTLLDNHFSARRLLRSFGAL